MTAIEKVGNVTIDQEAILKALNLNPRDPKTQALLVVCERYQLDPLLKHMVLISGNPYITRDGYLAVAHRSGQFDGMEVLETSESNTYWSAKVAVWRKDMSHPFTYEGRYPKSGHQKNYGPEMAIKCAEVMGLRRAFNVVGVGAADEVWDQEPVDPRVQDVVGADSRKASGAAEPRELAPTPPLDVDITTGEIKERPTPRPRTVAAPKPKAEKSTIVEAAQQVKAVDPIGEERFAQLKARKEALSPSAAAQFQGDLSAVGLMGFSAKSPKADAEQVEALLAAAEANDPERAFSDEQAAS